MERIVVPIDQTVLDRSIETGSSYSSRPFPSSKKEVPMKRLRITIIFLLATFALGGFERLANAQEKAMGKTAPMQEKSLYQRLGGYDAIAAVVDDFIGRLVADPQFVRFFAGHSVESKKRIRQLIVDQLCMAAGGPCYYTGRTMKSSHEGLGITEADWQASVRHLVASLDKFKVPQKEKDEVLAAVSSFKADIVATP
jgi:hemoglobin